MDVYAIAGCILKASKGSGYILCHECLDYSCENTWLLILYTIYLLKNEKGIRRYMQYTKGTTAVFNDTAAPCPLPSQQP